MHMYSINSFRFILLFQIDHCFCVAFLVLDCTNQDILMILTRTINLSIKTRNELVVLKLLNMYIIYMISNLIMCVYDMSACE